MITLSDEDFDACVDDALDSIPTQLTDRLDNVAVLIEDEPSADQLPPEGTLFGLYVGTPLPQRMSGWEYGALPDRIYIFRGPLRRACRSVPELREQIRVTVLHEIGHYFGIDDDRLHELGWA
ncbi:metallopeptidase family protein [Calidifontibacter sp. DB0510]|uniref:Metallopeptidase family protein n=1 Tax=Metallococcus carri TaxID=1656884 RepID=A0A967B0B3_9MICO|nr:metallopeptidase family protein [Metallococcus carri]NHN55958.1 metallopeptidase family protein [Metallococcus carri]NOP37585.1 metallopeptidase family protein [Calidifontibacter sp. DB2511S]